jgi:hypothetical protein
MKAPARPSRPARALLAALASLAATPACGGGSVAGPATLGGFTTDPVDRAEVVRIRGELDGREPRGRRDTFEDPFVFFGYAGEPVTITLRSADIDCYLYVFDASAELVGEDDDGGGSLDSIVELTLPRTGIYRVVATSYGEERGSYDLRLERRGAATYPRLPAGDPTRFALEAPSDLPGEVFRAYAVPVESVGGVRVTARSDAAMALRAFDSVGRELASAGPAAVATLEWASAPGSVVFVLVASKLAAGQRAEVALYREATAAAAPVP